MGAGGGVPTGRRKARRRKSGVPRCVLLSKFAFRRRGQQCRNCAYPGLGRVSESPAGDEKQAPVVGGRSRDGASEAGWTSPGPGSAGSAQTRGFTNGCGRLADTKMNIGMRVSVHTRTHVSELHLLRKHENSSTPVSVSTPSAEGSFSPEKWLTAWLGRGEAKTSPGQSALLRKKGAVG